MSARRNQDAQKFKTSASPTSSTLQRKARESSNLIAQQNLDLPKLQVGRRNLAKNPSSHSIVNESRGGGRGGSKARFIDRQGARTSRTNMGIQQIDDSTYASQTNTLMSQDMGRPKSIIRSVNQINSSPQNIERLFYEACIKVKEGFQAKKFSFECPEYLQGTSLPVEALAFEKDILILIAKKMGVVLPHRLAIEAIIVAEKMSKQQNSRSPAARATSASGQEPDAKTKA